jgi:hypothetical protein
MSDVDLFDKKTLAVAIETKQETTHKDIKKYYIDQLLHTASKLINEEFEKQSIPAGRLVIKINIVSQPIEDKEICV